MLLKFAYQDFSDDKRFKNTTKVNIQNYQTLLGEFINYCIEHEVMNVEDINYMHVKQYLLKCQERGNKAGTINTKLLGIRAFLNYMVECEVIKNNPAKKVKPQKDDVEIDIFTDEQIRQMLNFYRRIKQREKSYVAYRDYMMIVLILGTGIRQGEIINLQWSDIDFINQNISVFGKNRRKETIPITEKLSKELAGYQTFCKQHWGEVSDYIFVKRNVKTGSTLYIIIQELSRQAYEKGSFVVLQKNSILTISNLEPSGAILPRAPPSFPSNRNP